MPLKVLDLIKLVTFSLLPNKGCFLSRLYLPRWESIRTRFVYVGACAHTLKSLSFLGDNSGRYSSGVSRLIFRDKSLFWQVLVKWGRIAGQWALAFACICFPNVEKNTLSHPDLGFNNWAISPAQHPDFFNVGSGDSKSRLKINPLPTKLSPQVSDL